MIFILNSGRYVWDESHEVAEYTNWAAGRPGDNDGNHDCVCKMVYNDWNALGWWDAHCSWDHEIQHGNIQKIHALCEIDL